MSTYAPGRLRTKAQSYFRDAQTFAELPAGDLAASGMTHGEWAVVYKAVAVELRRIADEMEADR